MDDELQWDMVVIQSKPRLLDCSLATINLLSQPWLGWHNGQTSLGLMFSIHLFESSSKRYGTFLIGETCLISFEL